MLPEGFLVFLVFLVFLEHLSPNPVHGYTFPQPYVSFWLVSVLPFHPLSLFLPVLPSGVSCAFLNPVHITLLCSLCSLAISFVHFWLWLGLLFHIYIRLALPVLSSAV